MEKTQATKNLAQTFEFDFGVSKEKNSAKSMGTSNLDPELAAADMHRTLELLIPKDPVQEAIRSMV